MIPYGVELPVDHVGGFLALHAPRGLQQLQPPERGGADALDAMLRRRATGGGRQAHMVTRPPAHLRGRVLQEELRITWKRLKTKGLAAPGKALEHAGCSRGFNMFQHASTHFNSFPKDFNQFHSIPPPRSADLASSVQVRMSFRPWISTLASPSLAKKRSPNHWWLSRPFLRSRHNTVHSLHFNKM